MERLRVVQRPPKSDNITVAQAKKAWLKVEREAASRAITRSPGAGKFVKKDTASSAAARANGSAVTKKTR